MADSDVEVRGPDWCSPGLDRRGGRYPLSVESPVLAMVDALVPGISTLTSLVRYYSLYWALANLAEERGFDFATCRVVLRRAEVAVAEAAIAGGVAKLAHGTDRIMSLRNRGGDWGPGCRDGFVLAARLGVLGSVQRPERRDGHCQCGRRRPPVRAAPVSFCCARTLSAHAEVGRRTAR